MYTEEFKLAKELAKEVGSFLLKQESKHIDSLEGKDIKLKLDKEAEKKIIESLQSKFDYSILSEEVGLIGQIDQSKPYWIIDPIDGTMNYSRNCPIACVSIALWSNDQPILGVVYDFFRDELFSGLVGKGAWLNNNEIQPSEIKERNQAILATGFPTYLDLNDKTLTAFFDHVKDYKKIRMFGSAALSLCYVACGRVDSYKEDKIKLWDIAAGLAINVAAHMTYNLKNQENYSTNLSVGV
ncbi:myo-inositol-1(or 4)-monophosphatase [Reichenbachiella faecimaris]|uniref:Inositol-1-monophosphatase n=1 Tax=Reichenbachiella faecimaris TaxID=692418 RepID=A0A1W2GCF3_REIFA|nr:inositol monophosphatase family protein [Reichenbachiella faecimaris]SMD34335.1 myo-inositol-1(or 4)-monophosphatase [Reichenbachiella faecimaris]